MNRPINHMEYLPDMEQISSKIMEEVLAFLSAYDYSKYTAEDVRRALSNDIRTPADFAALLSPAAEAFLEECMAIVVNSIDEVWEYFDEEGMDIEELNKDEITEAPEVFTIGDGRYLIVES